MIPSDEQLERPGTDCVHIGFVIEGEESDWGREVRQAAPLTIPLDSLRRHVSILGRSGAGKSVTAMAMILGLLKLRKDLSVLVLDRTGEFADSMGDLEGVRVYEPGRNLVVSPFAPSSSIPGAEESLGDRVERAVSLMEHHLQVTTGGGLTPLQARILREALAMCYSSFTHQATVSDLIAVLRRIQEGAKYLKGWSESVEAIVSRLHPFASGALAKVFDMRQASTSILSPAKIFEKGVCIVNLGALDTDEAKNLLGQVICKEVFEHGRMLGRTDGLRFLLMVDEAHHLAPNRSGYYGVLERYAIELRKYGMGLVVIATRPSLVSENILANCNTIICHSLTSSRDVDLALNYMVNRLEADRFMGELRVLEVGEALVQLNDSKHLSPLRCRITLDEEVLKLATKKHPRLDRDDGQELDHPGEDEEEATGSITATGSLLPARDDTAWLINERLPKWARDAAVLAYRNHGIMRLAKLREEGYAQRQVKDMVHGPHPLFAESGMVLTLTPLGEKIAVIGLAENGLG